MPGPHYVDSSITPVVKLQVRSRSRQGQAGGYLASRVVPRYAPGAPGCIPVETGEAMFVPRQSSRAGGFNPNLPRYSSRPERLAS